MKFNFFNSLEPNEEILTLLIKELKINVSDTAIKETLQNHPDFPSLLSLSDALKQWDIENVAVKVEKNNINQLDTPFLAYVINSSIHESLYLVKNVSEETISYRNKIKQKKDITKAKKDFLNEWTGIALLVSSKSSSGEKDFFKTRRKEFIQSINILALIGLVFLVSAIIFIKIIANSYLSLNGIEGYLILFLLKITGIFITLLLLWYEVDKANPALQRICTGLANTNCNAILQGKQAKFLGLLSWSEIGFFYFAGGGITLLSAGNSISTIILLVAWLNVIALPYTIFSVYYQWRIAKQWCVLCLTVQAVLILEFVTAFKFHLILPFNLKNQFSFWQIFISFIAPVICWFLVKPVLLKLLQAKIIKKEFSRTKFNLEIFTALLLKQKFISYSPKGLGISLGNIEATHTLIKVCNPYCGYCSKAHPDIEKLLKRHANLRVQIIFDVANNENDKAAPIVRHFMAIDKKGDKSLTEKALNDWYMNPEKNYEQFALKFPINDKLENQNPQLEEMDSWCNAMNITGTPVFFFNAHQLPTIYRVGDLDYFLSDFNADIS